MFLAQLVLFSILS